MVGLNSIPQWIEVLLGEKFFIPCLVHESEKKNTFCLDCCISLCPHCLPPHQIHHLLQIRRYVYQDVVRLIDAQKLIDCSCVQSYTTNNAKVVFLNQRPMTRQFKGSGNICVVCDRNLQDHYLFCSVSCKVHQMGNTKLGVTKHHFYSSELQGTRGESSLELEDEQMTHDSVLELPISPSGSSSGSVGALNRARTSVVACTATTDFVKKKRTTISVSRTQYRPICAPAVDFSDTVNRRKGVPHRSPLY
ncbi:hypothetical protein LOK49_LG11G02406 [Camellia lanceoleosa]|uniref:Uncharacterized protein n=1 Tax=Camellia lanceoleosa TaxID=1840588 RepID=A0ACC0G4T2_9ERIC|nr:hypothetical protein LOK49_LG11G02406 [Camellia lanceoleosa]